MLAIVKPFVLSALKQPKFKLFVVELLEYHLKPEKLPVGTTEIVYTFDKDSVRWRINYALANKQRFVNSKDSGWK